MKKKLSREERQQMARELSRKRMLLANLLMTDEGLSKSEALKLAHGAFHLYYLLKKGVVDFIYFTKDGNLREAQGTLNVDDDALFTHYVEVKRKNDPLYDANHYQAIEDAGRITYWDREKEAFRTCKVANLVGIERVRININKFFREP